MKLSDKGKDWESQVLDGNTITGHRLVMWRKRVYHTGCHSLVHVELWRNRKRVKIVPIKNLQLIEVEIREITLEEIEEMLSKKRMFLIKKGLL